LFEEEKEAYPFTRDSFLADTRKAAQVQGHALFGLIKKSLALRIHHEGLR